MKKWLSWTMLPWLITAAVAVFMACFAAANPLMATDAICRHAPMTEAFTAGQWSLAFHPRFGIGLPIAAGIVRWLSLNCLDGLQACCFVATFAWALGAIPVFGIAERVFDRRTAWFALVLYLICPQTLLWGLKGLREPFKMLGVLLVAESVLKSRGGSWRNFARAVVGFALLAWFKVDSVIFMPLFGLAYAIGDGWTRKTWTLAGAGLLILIPDCLLVYDWTGVFVPVLQYAEIARRFL